jgi:hypothetical protein
VRRQKHVHDREGRGGADAEEQQRLAAHAAGDGEDDRQHDDEAGVEEDREAHDQRRDAEGEGSPLLAEDVDHAVGQHPGAARRLDQAAEHRAEADEQRHRAEGAAEARDEQVGDGAGGDARREGREGRDDDEGEERVQLELDDEHQDQGDRPCGDREERRGSQGLCPVVHVDLLR